MMYQQRRTDARGLPIAIADVLQPLDDEAPVFAIARHADSVHASSLCPGWTTFGSYGVALTAVAGSAPTTELLAWAPWSSLESLSVAAVPFATLGAGRGFQEASLAGARLFDAAKGQDTVGIFDLATRTATVPSRPRLSGEQPREVSDGALVNDFGDPPSLALLRADGSWASLVQPSRGYVISADAIDRSDRDALVWVESKGASTGYTDSVVWTAPYAGTAGSIRRRRVAVLADDLRRGGADMVANVGTVLNVVGPKTAVLTRLVDGWSWRIQAPPGEGFVQAVWVDRDEVWISTADETLPNFRAAQHAIVRLRRDRLGAPTIAPGL